MLLLLCYFSFHIVIYTDRTIKYIVWNLHNNGFSQNWNLCNNGHYRMEFGINLHLRNVSEAMILHILTGDGNKEHILLCG